MQAVPLRPVLPSSRRTPGSSPASILRAACSILMAWLLAGAPVHAATAEDVRFPSLDGTELTARLFRPEAAATPVGTVVALHGCGGLWSARDPSALAARHQATAELLAAHGWAVLLPDSLRPRGERELCTQRIGARRITQAERRADALGALAWVARQTWADPRRLALLGWSHGGSAVLAAADGRRADVQATVKPAVAIAFYPGCGDALRQGWTPSTRVALLLGEQDDWTPPQSCIALGQAHGLDVTVYPDSVHGFDEPSGRVRRRLDVPNGAKPGEGVLVGPNPQARAAAQARVLELLDATAASLR